MYGRRRRNDDDDNDAAADASPVCAVCLEECREHLALGACGHMLCQACMVQCVEGGWEAVLYRCPECRRVLDVDQDVLMIHRSARGCSQHQQRPDQDDDLPRRTPDPHPGHVNHAKLDALAQHVTDAIGCSIILCHHAEAVDAVYERLRREGHEPARDGGEDDDAPTVRSGVSRHRGARLGLGATRRPSSARRIHVCTPASVVARRLDGVDRVYVFDEERGALLGLQVNDRQFGLLGLLARNGLPATCPIFLVRYRGHDCLEGALATATGSEAELLVRKMLLNASPS